MMLNPKPADYGHIDRSQPAQLIVVIDTEEEFDWSGGFSRENTSVQSMRFINRVQAIFDAYHITPVYVIDYPVASQPDGYRPLQEIFASGRCLIGAHLHPWVNPPFDETVNRSNSFPGNLPRSLEAKKLQILGETIGEHFGTHPTLYKAGRYGVGPHTADILEEQGYEVDLSVCPGMDYSAENGPDYTDYSAWPYWFGTHRRLLELPITVGFAGLLRRWGRVVHRMAARSHMSRLHAVGILARLGLMNKVWLTPEGYRLTENIELLRDLHRDGLRTFCFALHSPSVVPGNTPYVKSPADLDRFLAQCRQVFEYFIADLGGCPTTPLELKAQLGASTAPCQLEV